jgi:UDP-glucose 4-epimerase
LGTFYPTPEATAVRDYIHVEDLADAHILALERVVGGRHQILNLGNGSGFSVREVIEAAKHVTGRDIKVVEEARRAGDPPELVAASGRMRETLGWEPRKPEIETMIADAWAWHQANPDGYAPSA